MLLLYLLICFHTSMRRSALFFKINGVTQVLILRHHSQNDFFSRVYLIYAKILGVLYSLNISLNISLDYVKLRKKTRSQTFLYEEMCKSMFAMGKPKHNFIKNLNICYTITYHM